MELLFIRHGQSEWNAARRWQGRADTPLTELGRQQAFAAARKVGSVDAIVASTLQRAHDTALIIGGQIGVGPVHLHADLVERDVGDFSGLTHPEIEERWPGVLGSGTYPDFFESDDAVRARITAATNEIVTEFDGADTVLVVCHGGIVHAFENALGLTEPTRVSNLAGRRFGWDGSQLVAHERIDLLDDQEQMSTTSGLL